jgi:hypothetical protein
MRSGVALAACVVGLTATGCAPDLPSTHWTCDFDASESRPLSDQDASPGPDGSLPSDVCQNTCGTPATSCRFTVLEGGTAGAVCPVCTF